MNHTRLFMLVSLLSMTITIRADDARAQLDEAIVQRAIDHARQQLLASQHDDGTWGNRGVGQRSRAMGGVTALCTYALLQSGESPNNAAVRKAAAALADAKMTGTYYVSLRCMVAAKLAAWDSSGRFRRLLARDTSFLMKSNLPNGQWTYEPVDTKGKTARHAVRAQGDNSNSQFAVLALREAYYAGAKVPRTFWKKLEKYWTASQREDGGWNYRNDTSPSYGSMTGAGLATSYILLDVLHSRVCCQRSTYAPAERGLAWMNRHFRADVNPGSSGWWYYYLYSVERVGETSGIRYFGQRDWFAEGARALLDRTRLDGRGRAGIDPVDTAFSLIFLARGAAPVFMNKLAYGPGWNANPRDVAHVTWFLSSYKFERPLNWQIVSLDTPVEAWRDSSVLYMSVHELPSLTDTDVAKIRRTIDGGAMLWLDLTCQADDDAVDAARKFVRRIYPGLALRPLPEDHPIFSVLFRIDPPMGLEGVNNGCRELVLMSTPGNEISCAWQKFQHKKHAETFELAGNVYLYANDKQFPGKLHRRTTLDRSDAPPRRRIRVAHLQHGSTPNPCPTALENLSQAMIAKCGVGLEVLDAVACDDPRLEPCTVAFLTGVGTLTLSPVERRGLARFIDRGGMLVVTPAMGDADFNASALKIIDDASGGPLIDVSARDAMITGAFPKYSGFNVETVRYTRSVRVERRSNRACVLAGVRRNGRWAVVHTPYDLVNGMALHTPYNARGYELDHATRVAANVFLSALNPGPTQDADQPDSP